jgi:hypothetical protein
MDRRASFPNFQRAPKEYSVSYFNGMVNMLNLLITVLRSPGEGRQSTIVITNMVNSDFGLESGTLFQIEGQVYISVLNIARPTAITATGAVGSVVVTV